MKLLRAHDGRVGIEQRVRESRQDRPPCVFDREGNRKDGRTAQRAFIIANLSQQLGQAELNADGLQTALTQAQKDVEDWKAAFHAWCGTARRDLDLIGLLRTGGRERQE